MVFFTCDACGESLKKNAVEKHYQFQCRRCSVLSCVDCGKDFPGDAYKEHTKCISEEEKYSGKDFKPKPGANKGEAKQELWTHQVQAAINKCKADPKIRNCLERLKDYPNIPRKKAKFENFVKNSLGIRDGSIATRTWDMIAAEMTPPTPPPTTTPAKTNEEPSVGNVKNGTENGVSDDSSEKKLSKRERKEERQKKQNKDGKKEKKKKRKSEEEEDSEEAPKKKKKRKNKEVSEDEDEDHIPKKKKKHNKENNVEVKEDESTETPAVEEDAPTEKFSWEATIIRCLRKADDNELSLKKLKKKVLQEFAARDTSKKVQSEQELIAKFNKKVTKNPRLLCKKDKVKLVK